MDRVAGLRAFLVIAAVVLGALRLVHLAVPVMIPSARQGPVALAGLDDIRRAIGFSPMLPGYHPESLGARPVSVSVAFSPRPASTVVWQQGDHYLSIHQQRAGTKPDHPPLARPFEDVADSTWWMDGSRSHLLLRRGEYWVHLETSLSERELRRFADTLAEY